MPTAFGLEQWFLTFFLPHLHEDLSFFYKSKFIDQTFTVVQHLKARDPLEILLTPQVKNH